MWAGRGATAFERSLDFVLHNEIPQKKKQQEQLSAFPAGFPMNFARGKLANNDHVIAVYCDVVIKNLALGCPHCYQMIIEML